MSPFDYLKAINETKKDIMVDDVSEKEYNAFIINRGLSFFNDTVIYACLLYTSDAADDA